MSTFTEPRQVSFKAAEEITEYHAVIQTTDSEIEMCDGAGESAIGIAMAGASASGELVPVAIQGGGAKLKLAGTVARGGFIAVDSSGRGVAVAAEGFFFARAMESGVTGDIIGVEVVYGYAPA